MTLRGHTQSVWGVAITPESKTAVSASYDETLKVWNLTTGKCIKTLKGHTQGVYKASISPDGKTVISTSDDKTLKVWDLESGRVLQTLKGHSFYVQGVAVTLDGKRAVSASSDIDWAELTVTMPRNKAISINILFQWFLQQHPNLFPLLQLLLQRLLGLQ